MTKRIKLKKTATSNIASATEDKDNVTFKSLLEIYFENLKTNGHIIGEGLPENLAAFY